MKTQGVVIADDPVFVNWLQQGIGTAAEFSLVRASSVEDMHERLQNAGRIDVACFEFSGSNVAARAAMVEAFLEEHPGTPAVGIGADAAQEVVLAAMRSGVRDFFVLQRDDEHLPTLLSKVLRRSLGGGSRSNGSVEGRVFGVFSATAYEGTTFCAQHLALSLLADARGEGERVILVDVCAPPGVAGIFLNLRPAYSLQDAIQDVYRCDQTLVDTAFARHASGLYLLTLPEDRIGYPVIEVDDFLRLLDVLKSLFAYTVICIDAHAPFQALEGMISRAERSLLVADQSVLRSRHSQVLLRELRLQGAPLNRTRLVVDAFSKRNGLDPEHLAELLELEMVATLSGQPGVRLQAQNAGEPLSAIAAKDPYLQEIAGLAAQCLGKSGGDTARQGSGGLARWFGRS